MSNHAVRYGCSKATRIAQDALSIGKSVYDVVLENMLRGKAELDEVLHPGILTQPRARHLLQQTRACGDAA